MKPFNLSAASLRTWLISILVVLASLHLVLVGGSFLFDWPREQMLVRLFNVDNEYNVPTAYSSLLLVSIGLVALRLRRQGPSEQQFAWLLVSALFFYMAVDELFVLHERLSLPVREYLSLGFDSPFYHAWVIPAAIIGFVALASVYRLSHTLPKMWRLHFIELLVLYVLGVIAFEVVGTMLFSNQWLYYSIIVLGEESFELAIQSAILYSLYQNPPYQTQQVRAES